MANSYEDISAAAGKLAKGAYTRVLNSSKAIFSDATEDAVQQSRGILGTVARMSHGEKDLNNAVKGAFSKTGVAGGDVSWGTVAGSYIGASAAYRVASGGGLYRDKNGNNNIIGVPFV